MNITELIVDYLKQGHVVELPRIGTLSNQRQSAHMDDATRTFHAGQNAVSFSTSTNGNDDIVKHLAEVECVDMKIAQLMWDNYVNALNDKLTRTGSHQFPGIGELRMSGGKFQFDGIAEPMGGDTPVITDIKHYETDNTDPFAIFDAPKEEPKLAPEPIPEPIIPEELNNLEEPQKQEKPEEQEEPQILEEPKKQEEPIISEEPEKTKTETQAPPKKEDSSFLSNASNNGNDIFADIPRIEEPKKTKKKKKSGWLWLLLLLLLLAAGGYYYYTQYYHKADTAQPALPTDSSTTNNIQTVTETTIDTETSQTDNNGTSSKVNSNGYIDQINFFTFNIDLLEYNSNELIANRNIILNNLRDYWAQFLSSRHYSNALPYMQTELTAYIDRRQAELLDNEGYSVRRFFNADDYLYQFFYNELKSRKASRARVSIQSELMDYNMLDEMLSKVIAANNLNSTDVVKAATTVKPKTAEEPKAAPITAHIETSSKQGFDVIAGFYTNRQSAVKMASRLKNLGCDAYIIDQNHLYYVSMGSAPTRTAAEALYKQVTSWYNGSVAIKQW